MCSAWIEPQINVRRPARRVMLTGAFLCLPLVACPRQPQAPAAILLNRLFPPTIFIPISGPLNFLTSFIPWYEI